MSQENVDAFRSGFEAFNRTFTHGTDDYFDGLDEEVESIRLPLPGRRTVEPDPACPSLPR